MTIRMMGTIFILFQSRVSRGRCKLALRAIALCAIALCFPFNSHSETTGVCPGRSDNVEYIIDDVGVAALELYRNPVFADARHPLSQDSIDILQARMTLQLTAALRAFLYAVEESSKSIEGSLLKSPYLEGPVFYSNYEGFDHLKVDSVEIKGKQLFVSLEMYFSSPLGSTEWRDIAIFKCEGGELKLDDIIFDPTQTAGHSLRERIAIR